MLNKEELLKFRSAKGFNVGQLEKDYLQNLFLMLLSRNTKDELVFKGGTALQKTYGLDRFSEDLDFTLHKDLNVENLLNKIVIDMANLGFETKHDEIKSRRGKNYRLRIKGPLFDGTEKTIATIRIEISLRDDLILKPELKEIIPVYEDLQPYTLLVMNIEEILAEKIRTVLQREKARDVYDLLFLLKKGIRLNYGLIKNKAGLLGLKFEKKIFIKRIKEIKRIWKQELSGYINLVPDFDKAIKELEAYF